MALRDYVDEGPMGKRRLPVIDARPEGEEGDGDEFDDEEDAAEAVPGDAIDPDALTLTDIDLE